MTDDQTQQEQPTRRGRLLPVTSLVAGSLAGLVLGIGGVASAQTAETPAPSPSTSAPAEDGAAQDELCDREETAAEAETASSGA